MSAFLRLAAPARAIVARPAVSYMAARSFSASVAAKKDVIQQMYINGLKSYVPTPEAKDASKSQVKDFKAPVAPQAPAVDAASDLSAWETANVEIVEAVTDDAVEDEEEEEEEVEEAHH
ncbi:hypothetical protein DFQ27_007468 [Actinomortierella ambigua]|uniref:Uncharacterized protein n=1 Tax=Actinomortierella ambigua TaxID=1343610 RepID=A0A9P6QK96_9FUNG|nr:hypothetical protein DFQ26_000925 [Actinomortierella ambigua]KAG0268125.1 hypothetical protein DFQ27_007468 [Actinomortierella ambigua]